MSTVVLADNQGRSNASTVTVTVNGSVPAETVASLEIAGDDAVNAAEAKQPTVVVTGTLSAPLVGGDVVVVSAGGQSYTATVSGMTFTADITTPTAAGTVSATVVSSSGAFSAPISKAFSYGTIAPTVTLSSAAEASDQATQTITGTVISGGTALVAGKTVTFTDNGVALATAASVTVQSDGTFSAIVTLPNQGANSIVASVSDSYGNIGSSTALRDVYDPGPTVVAESATIVAGGTVVAPVSSGALAGDTDPDNRPMTITSVSNGGTTDPVSEGSPATIAGTYGLLTLNSNGSYSYAATNGLAIVTASDGFPIVDTFGFDVADSLGGVTASTLSETISLASGGTETVTDASGAATFSIGATALTLSQDTTTTYAGTIQDGSSGNTGGSIVVAGSGVLTLTGASTYTGGTTLQSGTLSLDHATSGMIDAASTGAITINSAVLELSADGKFANEVDIAQGAAAVVEATNGRTATLTGDFTVESASGQTAAHASFGSMVDTGTIVFDASTTTIDGALSLLAINGGTLQAAYGSTALGSLTANAGTTTRISTAGTLDFEGNNATIAKLFGTGTLTNAAGATTTINGGNFGGTFAGAGNVTFAGNTVLSGKSTLSGNTRIQPGTVVTLLSTAALDGTGQIDDLGSIHLAGSTIGAASLTGNGTLVGYGAIAAKVAGTLAYTSTSGGLVFSGTGNRFARALGGSEIDFTGGSDMLLVGTRLNAKTVSITGASVSLGADFSFAGTLDLGSGGTLDLGAHGLTLFGGVDFAGGAITGAGSLVLRGLSEVSDDSAVGTRFVNAGTLDQTGDTTLSFQRSGTLSNTTGANYDLTGNGNITLTKVALTNAGRLEKTGGTGTSTITGALINGKGALVEATSGTLLVTGTVANSGSIKASGGNIALMGNVSGTGMLDVEANMVFELGGIIAAGQTASFGSDGGTLQLDNPGSFRGKIAGFSGSDAIDVAGFSDFTKVLFQENAAATGGTLTLADASHQVNLQFNGQYTTGNFAAANGAVHYQPITTT